LRGTEQNPLRLLLVTARYLPYLGGVEHHVYQLARRFARAGVDVTVLTTDPSGTLPRDENSEGVRVLRLRAWPKGSDFYFAPDLYPVIARGNWDIVHVHSYHTLVAPMAILAALRAKIPYVLTFHGGGHSSRLRNALRGAHRAMLRPLLARADRLIAIALFEVELFGRKLGIPEEQFVIIPSGSDLPHVVQPVTAAGDPTLIASVGRLERYKGHHRIIEALPHILEQQPDTRLWIAGSGPYEQPLRRMARKLNVADHVEIRAIPMAERSRMAQELSKVGLVTLLSEYETQPAAIMEALALGRPALVADTSGLHELADQGLVRAIPLRSTAQQVAQAVLDQLHQPLLPKSVDFPTWDGCVADHLALYHSITGRVSCVS
jgi:glycogen synthase